MASKPQNKKDVKSTGKGNPVSSQKQHRGLGSGNNEKWVVAGILLLTFVAFFPSLQNIFVDWDDYSYITNNPAIKDLSFKNLAHIFNVNTYIVGNYHPLTILSLGIEYHFFKLNPFIYHLDNVLLHLLNVLGVYLFIKMLSGKWEMAAIVALLFGIHPMRVESVSWAAERKDVLYSFFFIAALCCYMVYLKKNNVKYYFAAIFLFLLSVLSKGQAVVLAPVLVLIDFFAKRTFDKKVIVEKIPFFILALLFGIVAMFAQENTLTVQRLESHTVPERLAIACYGIVMYLYKLFIPINLSCFYPYPKVIGGFFFIAPFIVIALLAVLYIFGRKNRVYLFGSLFFLITISIVLQLLPIGDAVIADRYTYIPYLGLFLFATGIYNHAIKKNPALKTVLRFGGIAVLAWFFILTFNRTKVWKDSLALWNDAIENYPSAVAYNNRGMDYRDHREPEKAFADFSSAIKINPDHAHGWNNRSMAFFDKGDIKSALKDNAEALRCNPKYAEAISNRGMFFLNENQDSVIFYSNQSLSINANQANPWHNMGVSHARKGNYDEAIKSFKKAIELNPNFDIAYQQMGLAYMHLNNFEEAENCMRTSNKINPSVNAMSLLSYETLQIGNKYLDEEKYDTALDHYLRSANADPNYADAWFNIGVVYYKKKDLVKAREYWKKTLQVKPDYKKASDVLEQTGLAN